MTRLPTLPPRAPAPPGDEPRPHSRGGADPAVPATPSGGALWAGGVRFGCTCSGKCCTLHGDYAYVFLRREEERQIATRLALSVREFRKRYTRRVSVGQRSLVFPDGHCVFLVDRRCAIYEDRPRQCRTWPFWEENLDPRVWEHEVASFCPGVGRGRLYSEQEIREVIAGRAEVGG